MSRPEVAPDEVVEIVIHGAMYPHLAAWVESRGFVLAEPEPAGPEAMRTLYIFPGEDLMKAAR